VRTILDTPPIPRIVPDGVFDAFSWCSSRALEWRAPDHWSMSDALTAENPAGMVFVMKTDLPFLPRELARLHAPGLGLVDEWALAPYGIDDATDELYAHSVPPGDALWLAADSLAGLFWGLHDWAHFHSHGPFIERSWTELQCDAAALAWLWLNRSAIGLDAARWCELRAEALRIGEARFAAEGVVVTAPRMDAHEIQSWVTPGQPMSAGR
jgi:hypothetical protein